MDVKIKSSEGNFKMRVAGCLVINNKLLTVKICDNSFYCLPGGHVHLNESSKDAIEREFKEEVNIASEDNKLIAVVEGFFSNTDKTKLHEVCYYYLINTNDNIEDKDYTYIENDEGKLMNLEFKWVELNKLKDIDFRPRILIEKLEKNSYYFEHLIDKE